MKAVFRRRRQPVVTQPGNLSCLYSVSKIPSIGIKGFTIAWAIATPVHDGTCARRHPSDPLCCWHNSEDMQPTAQGTAQPRLAANGTSPQDEPPDLLKARGAGQTHVSACTTTRENVHCLLEHKVILASSRKSDAADRPRFGATTDWLHMGHLLWMNPPNHKDRGDN